MSDTYTNPNGRLTLQINTGDVTIGPDGGVIVHRRCSVFPCEKNRAGDSEAPYVAGAHELHPGDAAVSFRPKTAGDHQQRMDLFGGHPGRSANAEAMAVVCVPWKKQPEPVFRPPAIGRRDNPIVSWFRSQPIQLSKLDKNLKRLPKLSLLHDGEANRVGKILLPRFNRFCGDHRSGWETDVMTPDLQHTGYGSDYAGDVSQLLTVICDRDIDEGLRHQLVVAAVQRGLDYLGAFADRRRNWMVDGGHMWGRWPLVVFAGAMLDIDEVSQPSEVQRGDLVEYQAFYGSEAAWWTEGNYGWRRGWNESRFLHKHPSQWTTSERGERWAFCGYFPHVMGAHVGIVEAMLRIGAPSGLGSGLTSHVCRWMEPLDDRAADDLRANGCESVVDAWGTSYAATGDAQLCAHAWR